ncbi:MAG: flavodoxin family protein [Bacteroidales bacterium]|nr:flavodoxin family protein [Bacteroidales bacterium]
MKITVITGSAHRHGTSALLADEFIKGATEAGHEVFRFDAAFKDVHPCLGCDTCINQGKGCVYKDDMQELNPHILEADVLVFASPIYYYNINAQIKAVMDRFYANNAALQGHKKAALLLTMADDSHESADGPTVFFDRYTNYMKWVNLGVIAALSCWTVDDIKQTDYPLQAYELGKKLK